MDPHKTDNPNYRSYKCPNDSANNSMFISFFNSQSYGGNSTYEHQ